MVIVIYCVKWHAKLFKRLGVIGKSREHGGVE